MSVTRALLLFLFLAMFNAIDAKAGPIDVRFSLDSASPSTSINITPADVLLPGPVVDIPGRSLGLQENFPSGPYDSLADFSFGRDPIQGPLYFSVDRVSVGLPGTAVFAQAQPGVASAAGDVFQALPPVGGNSLFIRGAQLGLAPGFFGDDLDGLELNAKPSPNTYFAIGRLSATNSFGAGTLASDILVSAGNGQFTVYATNAMMGLQPNDGIDGLVLWSQNLGQVADPGIDMALFSVDPFSPDAFTETGLNYIPCVPGHMSPADVCFTNFTGSFSLWASAGALGLRPDDNVDALATIPEPGGLVLLGGSLVAFGICRRRRRAARFREREMLPMSGRTPRTHQPVKLSCKQLKFLLMLLACLAPPVAALGQQQDTFSGGQVFFGISVARPDSEGVLFLGADVQSNSNFGWKSSDPILGNIDTGPVQATTWSVYGADPARVVFTGTGDGATINGDVLLAPYNQGVIDVAKGSQHLRYLVNLPCDPSDDAYACDVRMWSCEAQGASAPPSECPSPLLFTDKELDCPTDDDTSCFVNEGQVQDSSSALEFKAPEAYDPEFKNNVSLLIDENFRNRIDKVNCNNVFTPYLPGIQAFDNFAFEGGAGKGAGVGGDAPVARLYLKHAFDLFIVLADRRYQPWGLLSYYNEWSPDLIREHLGGDKENPTIVYPHPEKLQHPLKLLFRANRAPNRFATRFDPKLVNTPTKGYGRDTEDKQAPGEVAKEYWQVPNLTPPTGAYTGWGDQLETRILGIWASTPTNNKDFSFSAHMPEFKAGPKVKMPKEQIARDRADFNNYFSNVADKKQWKDFMYLASFEVASAFKCGKRVFAHSGGGAVIGFIMRLLDADPKMQEKLKGWPLPNGKGSFVVIGLEAVLSVDVKDLLNKLGSYSYEVNNK